MNLNQHPLSAAFPPMQEDEYNSLVESIQSMGLQNPIVLFDGMVIDGWHRYCACIDSGTQIKTINLDLSVNPQTYVIAQNKERRHLTKSQVALAAVKVYDWLPAKRPTSSTGAEIKSVPSTELTKTANEIAKISGVSTSLIEKAKAVESKASDEVKAKVLAGEISLKKAEETFNPKVEVEIADSENEYTAQDMLKDENAELSKAVTELTEKLAIGNYDGADNVQDIIAELKTQKQNLEVELNAVKKSRDSLLNENNQLKKQIAMQQKEIKKLSK